MQVAVLVDNSAASRDNILAYPAGAAGLRRRAHRRPRSARRTRSRSSPSASGRRSSPTTPPIAPPAEGHRPHLVAARHRRVSPRRDHRSLPGVQEREAGRPVIVALTAEGPEFSNRQHDQVVEPLKATGAAFNAIIIGRPSSSLSSEARERGMVLDEGTRMTGGARIEILAVESLGLKTEAARRPADASVQGHLRAAAVADPARALRGVRKQTGTHCARHAGQRNQTQVGLPVIRSAFRRFHWRLALAAVGFVAATVQIGRVPNFATDGGLAAAFTHAATAANAVSRRRRPGVAERDRDGRHRQVRHRPRRRGLQRLRGRREAGRDLLHAHEPPDRARAADRHEREHGEQAAHGAGSGRRLRQTPPAAGSRGSRRLRQPRRRAPELHEQRRRTGAGDPQDVRRRLDVAVQRRLHRAQGPEEGRREEHRRDPPAGHRRALGRRGHLQPAAVRRSARPRETVRDGDLLDRAARRRRPGHVGEGLQGSRVRDAAVLSRKPAGARSFRISSPISRTSTGRFPTSCRASTVGYTSKNPKRDGSWRRVVVRIVRPNLTARTKLGYFAPTPRS